MQDPPGRVRKRVRQACEPCRRKKGRCSGEKPTCSLCARLGQRCTYVGAPKSLNGSRLLDGIENAIEADDAGITSPATPSDTVAPTTLDERVQSLDDKVREVLDNVKMLTSMRDYRISVAPTIATEQNTVQQVSGQQPTLHEIQHAADVYLKYCHCQPLCLFSAANFRHTLPSRELELRLCTMGLTMRFDQRATGQCDYHARAKQIVDLKIDQGQVELSTLQCICMLAWMEFFQGRPQQAGIRLSIAIDLVRSSRLDLSARQPQRDERSEEYIRVLWSVIMLQYLIGTFGTITAAVDVTGLHYPRSDGTNVLSTLTKQHDSYTQHVGEDLGVIAYALQMTEAWYKTRQFVHHRGRPDLYPPWSEKSIYSHIMFRQMELEAKMPQKHRFKPSGFDEHPVEMLATNRKYWAPWLYLQMIYHTIVCTLNHPILLSLHLRSFRVNQIPELFLQHTADMIASHTDWMIHLIQLSQEKGFQFTDPSLGQYVAIIATIFLQQSYTEDQDVRLEKQGKYLICLNFVKDLGKSWPFVDSLAEELQKFEHTISRAYDLSTSQNLPHLSRHVDLSAFWRILDNTYYGAQPTHSILGPSLMLKSNVRNDRDMLSTRLLPEPTRVHSLAHTSASSATTPANTNRQGNTAQQEQEVDSTEHFNLVVDNHIDSPFLAQSFFALGQDFVGNVDDWFTWEPPSDGRG